MLADLRKWQAKVADLPQMPSVVRAHHSVPYGRVFKQWDTRGRLIVWANPGAVFDLPYKRDGNPSLTGIPVILEAERA